MKSLPTKVLLYSLKNDVLLPRTQLSLVLSSQEEIKIFEKSLKNNRLLALVQEKIMEDGALFDTGCLGRISSFSESDEGKIFVILTGVSRFDVLVRMGAHVEVSYAGYEHDVHENTDVFLNRSYLSHLMEEYLHENEIAADWDEIEDASDEHVMSSLTMACPFDPAEKQAILETKNLSERSRLITSFIEMANPGYKDKTSFYH